jgi:hypothetical protein
MGMKYFIQVLLVIALLVVINIVAPIPTQTQTEFAVRPNEADQVMMREYVDAADAFTVAVGSRPANKEQAYTASVRIGRTIPTLAKLWGHSIHKELMDYSPITAKWVQEQRKIFDLEPLTQEEVDAHVVLVNECYHIVRTTAHAHK